MENKKTISILLIIIVIAFVLLFIKINTKTQSISYNNQANLFINETIRKTTPKEEPKIVYIKEHYMKSKTIYGIVKNNTNNTVKNLVLSANCYDKDNNKLINTKNYLDELKPGETWKFNMWTHSNAVKYKNLKVTYK